MEYGIERKGSIQIRKLMYELFKNYIQLETFFPLKSNFKIYKY